MGGSFAFKLLAAASLLSLVNAACQHDLAERGREFELHKKKALELQALQKRQSPVMNLQSQMQMLDPVQECAYYNYPPVQALIPQYPPTWQIAQIVAGDNDARNAFNAIVNDPQMPNIPPKGLPNGDFSTVQYTGADPDCWWTWSQCDTPKHPGIPADVIQCPEPHTLGLTYDDGPNCTHNAFYNYLQQQDVRATMFFIGSNVMNWPLQAQRALADGHEIALHTWSHHYSTGLTNEQIFAELWYTRRIIKDIVGVSPRYWRPPFGDADDRVRFIANKMGLQLLWISNDTDDWKVNSVSNPNGIPTAAVLANYNAMYAEAQAGGFDNHGGIILSHEINGATIEIAMQELPAIKGTFKNVLPVAACLNDTHPYDEQSWTYPTFQQWVNGQRNPLNGTSSTSSTSSSSASPTSMTRTSSSSTSGSSTSHAGIQGNAAAASKTPGLTGAASLGYTVSVSAILAGAAAVLLI